MLGCVPLGAPGPEDVGGPGPAAQARPGLSASAVWRGRAMSLPWRHTASAVLNDLIIAFLVATAAVIASGLLDRVWDAL